LPQAGASRQEIAMHTSKAKKEKTIMESHQTDKHSQAGSVSLSEQELSSVSGGEAFTPEQMQELKRIATANVEKMNTPSWKALGAGAFAENIGNFSAHVGGLQTHSAASHH